MDETPVVAPPEAAPGDTPPTPSDVPAAVPRFQSLQLPSAPFWVVLIAGVIAVALLAAASSALFVFAIGVALAFFLVPLIDWLERRGVPRTAASILVVATLTVLALVGLALGAAILVEQGVKFVESLPAWLAELEAQFQELDLPDWLEETLIAVGDTIGTTLSSIDVGTWVIGFLQGLLGMLGLFLSFALLPFFLFYLLKDQRRMSADFHRNIPAPWKADVDRMITIGVTDFAQYFKAELLVGSIMFCIVSVGMFVIGSVVPDAQPLVTFALLLGLIAFVMELLPQIGPILSYLPALLLSLTIGPQAVVAVSVFYFIVFNIEGSILVPTFEGRLISFSGASVLVLIAMGFALGGILGAIVALPVAAIARDLFRLFFQRAQEQAGLPPAVAEAADAGVADAPTVSEPEPGVP
jgi:predicted PurR-regulated permease PerM